MPARRKKSAPKKAMFREAMAAESKGKNPPQLKKPKSGAKAKGKMKMPPMGPNFKKKKTKPGKANVPNAFE